MKAFNINEHKMHLTNILIDVYKTSTLGSVLGFKGGSAAMFFYGLPRFSVDLDFDLTKKYVKGKNEEKKFVDKLTKILKTKYEIKDYSRKYNTIFWLLSYGFGTKKIKIEISSRENKYNHYNLKPFYGVSVKVLNVKDSIAHKLITVTERKSIASRDLFDAHYFLSSKYATDVNYEIIKHKTGKSPKEFYKYLLKFLETVSNKRILNGIGELLTESQKNWVRSSLLIELKDLIRRQIDLFD